MMHRHAASIRTYVSFAGLALIFLAAAPARAQIAPRSLSDPATGERYHVEAAGAIWSPMPNFIVSSQSLGIIGTEIDAVSDLGVQQTKFGELRLVLRPSRKSKFRFDRIPAKYTAAAVLRRSIVFNGQRYNVGVPVNTDLQWTTFRIGYEYDFYYGDRGFAGLILDVKATDVQVQLASPFTTEFARARAPIPALGGIGRAYVAPNISLTFEVNGVKIPESLSEDYKFRYVDFDLYGTVNFTNNVGAQIGYRSLDVIYKVKDDDGTLKLKGLYFGGVLRY
jgi:hypothetical protein